MPRLIWSPEAVEDLVRLHAFLVTKSPDAARRAIKAIRQQVKPLARHPEAGRFIEDMPPEFMEWFMEFGNSGYLALYHFDGKKVVVLAVRHGLEAGYQ
jgi:plasmid stabilization system protein ParE